MMKKSEGDRSLRFRRHGRFFGKTCLGKFGERFLATREFWYLREHFGLVELSIFAGLNVFPQALKHKNDLILCLS